MTTEARVLAVLTNVPRTKAEIAAGLRITPREVEAAVETLRKRSLGMICSGAPGYWRASTLDEYRANVAARRRRYISQALTVRGELRLIRRLTDPRPTLWEAAG